MSPERSVLAIDPGLHGAWAAFHPGKGVPIVGDLPVVGGRINIPALCEEVAWAPGEVDIVLERQQSLPGQGIASTHKNGLNYGMLLGWAYTVDGSSIHEVRPWAWKKALRLGKDKEASRAMAINLWPPLGAALARKKDEGRAEAILLGYYWQQYGK